MKFTARIFSLILFLFVSGCSPLSNAPETENDSQTLCEDIGNWEWVSNAPEDNPQGFAHVGWEEYRKIHTLPAMRISKIKIEYSHSVPYDFITRCVVIKSSWGSYITNDGIIIDSDKFRDLADSFTNLRLSSGIKTCEGSEYQYATFDIEIEYANGKKAILYTASNCAEGFSPWNIVYGNKSYFQSSGEIPNALYEIIASFDTDIEYWWKPGTFISANSDRRPSFQLNSYSRIAGSPYFSEENIFREHLSKSKAFAPYLETFNIDRISLTCPVGTNCSEMESRVNLISKENISISLNILVSGKEIVVTSPLSANEWAGVNNKLLPHPFIQTVRSAKKDTIFRVDCWQDSKCANNGWCAYAHETVGQTPAQELLACSVEFSVDHPNVLVFLPDIRSFWVKEFGYDFVHLNPEEDDQIEYVDWLSNVDIFTNLFKTSNFPAFVEDHGKSFFIDDDTGQCNSIGLGYDYVTVHTSRLFERELRAQSPAHIWIVRSSASINQIDINGYCVFISPNGEFVLYQP